MTSATPEPTGRVARRRARNRELMLEAAERLFAERPFAAVRIEDIAEAADVAVGSVYLHFTNKDGILLALAEVLADRATKALLELQTAGKSKLELFSDAGLAYMNFLVDNPVFVRYLATEPATTEAQDMSPVAERMNAAESVFRALIQSAIDAGELRVVDAALMAKFLIGAWNGVAVMNLRSNAGTVSRDEVLATLQLARDVIYTGIKTG